MKLTHKYTTYTATKSVDTELEIQVEYDEQRNKVNNVIHVWALDYSGSKVCRLTEIFTGQLHGILNKIVSTINWKEIYEDFKAEQRTAFDSLPSLTQSVHKNVSLNERYRAINKLGRAVVSLCLCLSLFSCATTKLNKQGERVETVNTRHLKKVHPYGFYAAGNYVNYSPENKTEKK